MPNVLRSRPKTERTHPRVPTTRTEYLAVRPVATGPDFTKNVFCVLICLFCNIESTLFIEILKIHCIVWHIFQISSVFIHALNIEVILRL